MAYCDGVSPSSYLALQLNPSYVNLVEVSEGSCLGSFATNSQNRRELRYCISVGVPVARVCAFEVVGLISSRHPYPSLARPPNNTVTHHGCIQPARLRSPKQRQVVPPLLKRPSHRSQLKFLTVWLFTPVSPPYPERQVQSLPTPHHYAPDELTNVGVKTKARVMPCTELEFAGFLLSKQFKNPINNNIGGDDHRGYQQVSLHVV